MFRTIVASFIIALLFSGSVGVDIFKHICRKDGVTVSLFMKSDHNCKEMEKSHSCCKKEKKDCCEDEVSCFHIKLDYFNTPFDFKLLTPLAASQPIWEIVAVELPTRATINHFPQPPPLAGRDILILNQVFII